MISLAFGRKRAAAATPLHLTHWRAMLALGLLAAAFAMLFGRAVYLQAVKTDFLQQKGESRYSRVIEIHPHRGRITDRNGEALAISTPVKSIWAIPSDVKATPAELAKLATLLDLPQAELKSKLAGEDSDFTFLKRQVPPDVADKVAALRLEGINQDAEYKRFYPAGEVAAHVLGWTGIDDNGQEGIELAQQEWLAGKSGSRRVIRDRRGAIVEDVESIRTAQAGRDLTLSIDSKLQYLAFKELKAAVEANKAKAGGIVVLDARTGEILALANSPSFNPNNRTKLNPAQTRNRALTDTFEPGSTMKPFTAAASLDAGLVRPDTLIATGNGSLQIGSATIHDAHPAGTVSVAQAIQKSSNVALAKIALQLPPERMWSLLSRAGFGTPPKTGFPGEVGGRLRPYKSWRPIEQATMAYGHGMSVNLVQLARAYTIFAGDGQIKPVSLFKTEGETFGPRVISPETALAVRNMMEMAVQPGGTAPKAQISGYRVAGKTGTAHKLEGRSYVNKYVSSFVGLAPASNPRLIVAVMIDEPSAGHHYGGTVAGPVFAQVMGQALKMLGVPPDAPINNVLQPPAGEPEVKEEV